MRQPIWARVFGILFLALAASLPASAGSTRALVLRNGSTLTVSGAEVRGGMVLVTFPDGRMQAYQVDDVDLGASGLVPRKKPAREVKTTARPQLSLAQRATAARYQITDADVKHVEEPAAAPAGAGKGEKKKAPVASLQVSNLRQRIDNGVVHLSGTLVNSGAKPVSTITVTAVALDGNGKPSGRGQTVVARKIDPQGSAPFTLSFPVSGPVFNVQVRALAAVASFDFKGVPPPARPAEPRE